MTDCVICGRATDGYACEPCTRPVHRDLIAAAALTDDTLTTIARLDRLPDRGGRTAPLRDDEPPTTPGGKPRQPNWLIEDRPTTPASALRPTAAPVNLDASSRVDAATGVITTWARMVIEERGLPTAPAPAPLAGPTCEPLQDCRRHRTCRAILGQHRARPGLSAAGRAALLLTNHLTWLRHHPAAAEALPELGQACRDIIRTVDRPAELELVGACDCGVRLYAKARAATITCRHCGKAWNTDSGRAEMTKHIRASLVTGAEYVTLHLRQHPGQPRKRVRDLIAQWARRGHIQVRGLSADGDPLYRYGDIDTRMNRLEDASSVA
ncbi:hypothetical protein GCM10010124_26010 [Pilimelia terevasa]|uniref:Uncharacterized protein n=1 Tax=Pilimelia terevasa TaxID=53372 RepID=A0A8J3BRP8_9ACTN|nr:hypothetical protein [Pilimelia terevasa]GGK32051.1 hypothetical protein GCM10010124_26010 [Pilimelia terevasa]